jgi:hypothetical protein
MEFLDANVTLKFLSGKLHTAADVCSRIFAPELEAPTAKPKALSMESTAEDLMAIQVMGKREELAFEQKSDPFISTIITNITSGQEYPPEYTFGEQLLWYQDDKSPSPRIVIPQSMIAIILDSYHNSILAGHLGVKKTLTKIAQRYWWPSLRSDVENYVLSCHICLRTKARQTKPPGIMQNRIIPERPFDKIQFDLIGPLKAAKVSRAQYILVVCSLHRGSTASQDLYY